MKGKRQNLRWKRKRTGSTRRAVVVSAVLGLLVMLFVTVVANLIHVPAGWEWVAVAAMIVVFLASLPVTMALARESQKASQERGTGQESAGMKVEVARGAELIDTEWSGDVGNVINKGADSASENEHAGKH
jgi:Na+/melibiose symporter-like transporter